MGHSRVGYLWISGRECIGIALIYDRNIDKLKAYIKTVSGQDEEYDIVQVLEWGSKFPVDVAIELVKRSGYWCQDQEATSKLIMKKAAW